MSDSKDEIVSGVPLFDVSVRMGKGRRIEEVERLAHEAAGMPAANIKALVGALRGGSSVKVGSRVTRERADQAGANFLKAGLEVDITPVLSISAIEHAVDDGKTVCPACSVRVLLPENRQCPSCGVFVDKITDEMLLKKKLMEQERRKLEFMAASDLKESERKAREAMELALREKIRKELEKEFGIGPEHGLFKGKAGRIRAAGLAGLLAVAFAGGHFLSTVTGSSSKSAAAASKAANNAPKVAVIDAEGSTGDADIDDPLIQAARGKRAEGQGMSIEQAIAASQTLAKSVGHSAPAAGVAGTAGKSNAATTSAAAGGSGPAPISGGATAVASDANAQAPKVSMLSKFLLKADFSTALAEIGQLARAREVIAELKKAVAGAADRGAAAAVQVADAEVDAWSLLPLAGRRVTQGLDALKASAAAMNDPAVRAQALSRAGVILIRHAQLPSSVSRDLLKLAADSLPAIRDPQQRSAVQGDWSVAVGEALSLESTSGARAAVWSRAQAAAAEVDAMIKKAPDEWSQARLYAIDHQLRGKLGQADKATQSLDAALALVTKVASLSDRAAKLRTIAQLAGTTARERLSVAIAALQPEAESKTGLEKAQTLTHLALLHADAGARAKADQTGLLAQQTPDLSATESMSISTELVVRGDMAAAKVQHAAGLYSEAERILQRLASYLL